MREEWRHCRRAGDPRITPEGREILMRLVAGDLMGEFQAELDRISAEDPTVGGGAGLDRPSPMGPPNLALS